MSSPTERTLKRLRKEDYLVAVVERWNQYARIRQDLFGFIDLIGVGNGHTLGVQATSYANTSSRIKKIVEDETLRDRALLLLDSGWEIQVWGWKKKGRFWEPRIVDMRENLELRSET